MIEGFILDGFKNRFLIDVVVLEVREDAWVVFFLSDLGCESYVSGEQHDGDEREREEREDERGSVALFSSDSLHSFICEFALVDFV